VQLGGLGKLKKFIYLVDSLTCDLPACSIVLQPLPYLMPTNNNSNNNEKYISMTFLRDWKKKFAQSRECDMNYFLQ
jgi:hypothetical protein